EASGKRYRASFDWLDLESGKITRLPSHAYRPPFVEGRWAAAGDALIELDSGQIRGEVPEGVEWIDTNGRLLMPAADGRPPIGPLRWVKPSKWSPEEGDGGTAP